MRRSMKRVVTFLIAALLSTTLSYADIIQKEITAEGMAPGSNDEARETAVNRALRKAVEEGVGVIIDSETIVGNYQILDDEIYSTVKGYVTGYEVVFDNGGEGGLYKVKLKATVASSLKPSFNISSQISKNSSLLKSFTSLYISLAPS